jgi:carbon-monoxide dehydrogenase medium subunit
MKPASVGYERVSSVDEAVGILADGDGEAKILAGGQSLIPLMSMRLARPSTLVDINRLSSLDYIRLDDGHVVVGALTRHRTVEKSPVIAEHVPLLSEAMRYVGHVTIRNRGTIGGSAAHSDPAAELPATLKALDAEFVLTGPTGTRAVPAEDFFLGFLTTATEASEMLTEIRIPALPAGTGCAVEELTRRHGDFALVAVFVAVRLDDQGVCREARIAVAGTNPVPLRAAKAEATVIGERITATVITAAGTAVADATDPRADIHGPPAYRRDMAAVLTRRALVKALARANGEAL